MAGTRKRVDHAKRTKLSFLLGVGLFVTAELVEPLQHAVGLAVPGWEQGLLIATAGAGILLALLSPFVFGILLPLIE